MVVIKNSVTGYITTMIKLFYLWAMEVLDGLSD